MLYYHTPEDVCKPLVGLKWVNFPRAANLTNETIIWYNIFRKNEIPSARKSPMTFQKKNQTSNADNVNVS